MARWHNPYGSCPICGVSWMKAKGLFLPFTTEHCLPRCELCGKEIRADLCAAVYREIGGKWTARHKQPCPD